MIRIAPSVVVVTLLGLTAAVLADGPLEDRRPHRFDPTEVRLKDVPRLNANMVPVSAGGCPVLTTGHTDADFSGGSFIVQAGFAQNEIAAASYTLMPTRFRSSSTSPR